jgi:hypothetical protein
MLSIIARMLRDEVSVGLVGLDEPTPAYVARLCSALSVTDVGVGDDGHAAEWLEEHWNQPEAEGARERYKTYATRLWLSHGARPTLNTLTDWLSIAPVRPEVVFIDYLQLLARGKYDGNDNTRVPRLAEELSVWAGVNEVAVVALHQVGRESKTTGTTYHGDTPLQLESLRSGGEEAADIVLGTYRPALSPLGNMEMEEAEADLGKDFSEERWLAAVERCKRYEQSTFLQLLKNRPSQKGLLMRGVELFAPGHSMFQRERDDEDRDDDAIIYDMEAKRGS